WSGGCSGRAVPGTRAAPPDRSVTESNMNAPPEPTSGWQVFALGSALFGALTALLGKVGVSEVNSNLATLIRTGVILVVAAGIVTSGPGGEPPAPPSRFGFGMTAPSGVATGLAWW